MNIVSGKVEFDITTSAPFSNVNEARNWMKSNHTFETADNGAEYPKYDNLQFEPVKEKNGYRIQVSFRIIENNITQNVLMNDIEDFIERADEDGNYPVDGEPVKLRLMQQNAIKIIPSNEKNVSKSASFASANSVQVSKSKSKSASRSRSASSSKSKSRSASSSRSASASRSQSASRSTSSSASQEGDNAEDELVASFMKGSVDRRATSMELKEMVRDAETINDANFDDVIASLDKNMEMVDKLKTATIHKYYKSDCLRSTANWANMDKTHKFDHPEFDPTRVASDMKLSSPKLRALLDNIRKLDEEDMRKHGRKFKHFIFSDLKSNAGAKIVAAGCMSDGYSWAMKTVSPSSTKKVGGATAKAPKIKLAIKSNDELREHKGKNFFLLTSTTLFGQPMRVDTKKSILKMFNERPTNVYGDLARIIIMDSGFKEGIDLFDIKYVHIYEPQTTMADQKQVIGRGTRTCGQKGLKFHPKLGWPLHVYKYDVAFNEDLQTEFEMSATAFELYLKSKNVDVRLFNLTEDMEKTVIYGAVDHELNRHVHMFSVEEDAEMETGSRSVSKSMRGGSHGGDHDAHAVVKAHIADKFSQFTWDKVKMENLCGYDGPASMAGGADAVKGGADTIKSGADAVKGGADAVKGGACGVDTNNGFMKGGAGGQLITFSPTQDFVRHYFTPENPIKGMLLYQSVGTGKTCTAIATATSTFEPAGYTILWVTRTTLRNDIWKNMFDQVCNMQIRDAVAQGVSIPDAQDKRMKMLSKSWSIRPMSYKQFSNLVSKKNLLYKALVKKNGAVDPLRKTLLIIDEAHKLFGGNDLSSIERPDTNALHAALMNSYMVSGADSVRLMLMTATPITQDPLEMVKLLNLCKLPTQQIPDELEAFASTFLDEQGRFTDHGRVSFLNQIAGMVSYLNRENDARQFSRPILHNVMVPLASDSMVDKIKKYDPQLQANVSDRDIKKMQAELDQAKRSVESMKKFKSSDLGFLKKRCEAIEHKQWKSKCKKYVTGKIKDILSSYKTMKADMNTKVKSAKTMVKELVNKKKMLVKAIRGNVKTGKLEKAEDYLEYRNTSMYARLKDNCVVRKPDNVFINSQLKQHPSMILIDRALDTVKQKDDELRALETDMDRGLKSRLANVRQIMKGDLNELERSVMRLTLKSMKKDMVVTKRAFHKSLEKKMKTLRALEKRFTKKRRVLYTGLRKTAKTHLKELKKEDAERKKVEKKALAEAKKLAGKVTTAVESIEELEDTAKELVKDRMDEMDVEIETLTQEANLLHEADERRKAERELKVAERAEKKAERDLKAAERAEAKAAKDAALAKKKADKDASDAVKAQAKEMAMREKEAIAREKLAAKEAKEAEKALKLAEKALKQAKK